MESKHIQSVQANTRCASRNRSQQQAYLELASTFSRFSRALPVALQLTNRVTHQMLHEWPAV